MQDLVVRATRKKKRKRVRKITNAEIEFAPIGLFLETIKEQLGINQIILAKHMDCSQAHLSTVKRGLRPINHNVALTFKHYLATHDDPNIRLQANRFWDLALASIWEVTIHTRGDGRKTGAIKMISELLEAHGDDYAEFLYRAASEARFKKYQRNRT